MAEQKPITPQQTQAIVLLVSGSTQTAAAAEIGVDVATLNRWVNGKQSPGFVAAYNEAKQAIVSDCEQRLSNLYDLATQVLIETLEDAEHQQRVNVALAIYKAGLPTFGSLETNPDHLEKKWRNDSLFEGLNLF